MAAAFAYNEPSIGIILNQTGFLLVLNIVNLCLNKLLYCGLIGQLFIGVLWGTPGAKWLNQEMQTAVQQLGYLGLIMLVYEGGISTSIKALRANLMLSLSVAITGIGVPMALSFVLKKLVSASSLQAFAAGAALSATSLGTTFTILSTTQLIATRLGTVITCAAMLDDVIGLVMVQIISNLSQSTDSFDPMTIIRPLFVSLGFAVGLFLVCTFCLKPILRVIIMKTNMPSFVRTMQFAFIAHTFVLVGLVAGATYAGSSNLFAAYLAGVIVSWFDGFVAESREQSATTEPGISSTQEQASSSQDETNENSEQPVETISSTPLTPLPTGGLVFEKYYKEPVNRILIPLFFASIGFAIPVTEMFQGKIVWRGVVYAILMAFGKMVTGLWLIRFSLSSMFSSISKTIFFYIKVFCATSKTDSLTQKKTQNSKGKHRQSEVQPIGDSNPSDNTAAPGQEHGETEALPCENKNHDPSPNGVQPISSNSNTNVSPPSKPRSLYPPSVLGLAMVARGEVGYLIASLAESQGIFSNGSSDEGSSEIFLVVIWAISICTLIGPICVGTLVKRLKKLQQLTENSGGPDPLGVWGI